MTGADHSFAKSRESRGCDAACRQPVLLENFRERQRRSRRRIRLAPVLTSEFARDRLDFGAGARLRGAECLGAEPAVAKKTLRVADAADFERLETLGLQATPDDELGRAAADIDAKARSVGWRQHVRDAEINESRFFMSGDDVDRKAERCFGLPQKLRCIASDPKRVRGHGAHRGRMQAAQPFRETREAAQCSASRGRKDAALGVDRRADPQCFAPRVETKNLIAFNASELEAKAVRSHVDHRKRRR